MKSGSFGAAVAVSLFFALPAASAETELADALASASADVGARVFKKCAACHTVKQGERNKTGPNLYGVVGGTVAGSDGFKYSAAMTGFGGMWSLDRLDAFLTKPRTAIKGTRMSFTGLRKITDRANLIAYLNTFSDAPLAFAEGTGGAAQPTELGKPEFGNLKIASGVEPTYYACTACHSEMIVAQQGMSRKKWEELFEWMVEEQGMSEIQEPELTEILNYLAEHYNEDRPNFPRPQNN